MTQEEKELLLKDLGARLFYGVKVLDTITDTVKDVIGLDITSNYIAVKSSNVLYTVFFDDVKPYLRPLSSMTEEECIELGNINATIENVSELIPNVPYYIEVACSKQIDWLNKKMFDYRGLIEKGLAIEVTKENNPYEA